MISLLQNKCSNDSFGWLLRLSCLIKAYKFKVSEEFEPLQKDEMIV